MIFKAYKHKCTEDVDGEVTLILKVSMQDKARAYEIPVKTILNVTIEPEDE